MITGKITDKKTGETLPGASIVLLDANNKPVLVNGQNVGTTTNANGQFSFAAPVVGNKVQVSYVGYVPVIVGIVSTNPIEIMLESSTTNLSEVEITAKGTKSKLRYVLPIAALLLIVGYVRR
jgi:hypothetical protein